MENCRKTYVFRYRTDIEMRLITNLVNAVDICSNHAVGDGVSDADGVCCINC